MPNNNQKSERIKLLDFVPVKKIEHFGRPLKQHLIGTHDLLDEWENSEDVCLAGLFHSVYGTNTFLQAALTTESRDDVRSLIGERAEALVYVFGMSDRKSLLLDNRSAPYCWIDHRSGRQTEICNEMLSNLVEMEVANFIEQLPFRIDKSDAIVRDMQHRFEANTSRMSVGAKAAFCRVFDKVPKSASESAFQSR